MPTVNKLDIKLVNEMQELIKSTTERLATKFEIGINFNSAILKEYRHGATIDEEANLFVMSDKNGYLAVNLKELRNIPHRFDGDISIINPILFIDAKGIMLENTNSPEYNRSDVLYTVHSHFGHMLLIATMVSYMSGQTLIDTLVDSNNDNFN